MDWNGQAAETWLPDEDGAPQPAMTSIHTRQEIVGNFWTLAVLFSFSFPFETTAPPLQKRKIYGGQSGAQPVLDTIDSAQTAGVQLSSAESNHRDADGLTGMDMHLIRSKSFRRCICVGDWTVRLPLAG